MSDASPDPDRFLGFENPGSQEWWYFDAISEDGRDVVVIVWYVGLPFDPKYSMQALRHYRHPERVPGPRPLDFSAIGFSWYRDGKTVAYALNHYDAEAVEICNNPVHVKIGPTSFRTDRGVYHLILKTPGVDGRSEISADLRFEPASRAEPFERDLGGKGSPHYWMPVAPDCRVEGSVQILGGANPASVDFMGRGYHDHNAGFEEISIAWKRWRWERVHFGPFTAIHYQAEPKTGRSTFLAILCENGVPIRVREHMAFEPNDWGRSVLGIRHDRSMTTPGNSDREISIPRITRRHRSLVDGGPFYLRWLSDFEIEGRPLTTLGISEQLEAGRLNRPYFNWMIPFRLKRLGTGISRA